MNETIEYQNIHGNRKHKDELFRMVFSRKEDLLDLYNAINETNYKNVDDLEVNTLDNVLYMTMKNDISFMIGCTMNLYEHQSSYNPNMPLRGLIHFARLYNKYADQRKLNLYSSTLQKIPAPRFIVFYNGLKEKPDREILKLSEAFLMEHGCLECEATMLNINRGRNHILMERCRRLEEYSIFIDTIREYSFRDCLCLEDAITLALDDCIEKGILLDVLKKQKAEVFAVILETFDKELYERDLIENTRREAREEVIAEVREEVIAEVREEIIAEARAEKLKEQISKKLHKGKSLEEIADALEEDIVTIRELVNEIGK